VWFGAGGLLLAGLALLATGCGEEPLRVYCGAGIRPPVARLADEFSREHGIEVAVDYAGAEVLLSRIKLSGEGDLYMPGDVHYVDLAAEEGLVASQHNVCYFVPVILVQKGNPKNIRGLTDLVRPGVKLGLGDPEACAIGRTCREIFEKNGMDLQAVERNVAFCSLTVNELGNHIKLRDLDAVIVWDAVAAYFAEHSEVVAIPPEENVYSTVAVGVLKSARHPDLADRFVEFITSEEGREVFREHHYTVDPAQVSADSAPADGAPSSPDAPIDAGPETAPP